MGFTLLQHSAHCMGQAQHKVWCDGGFTHRPANAIGAEIFACHRVLPCLLFLYLRCVDYCLKLGPLAKPGAPAQSHTHHAHARCVRRAQRLTLPLPHWVPDDRRPRTP